MGCNKTCSQQGLYRILKNNFNYLQVPILVVFKDGSSQHVTHMNVYVHANVLYSLAAQTCMMYILNCH